MPSESTINKYEGIIKTLVKRGMTDIKDTTKVLEMIKTKVNGEASSMPSRAANLNALIYKVGEGTPEQAIYRKAMMETNNHIFGSKDYRTSEKSVPWEELSQLYLKATSDRDKAMLAIYSLAPPRRVMDYTDMMVVDTEPTDTDKNYLLMEGEKGYFIFNKYKTAGAYGKQEFEVPSALMKILRRIAIVDNWLFRTNRGNKYTSPSFTATMIVVSGAVSEEKVKATANTFRHSYISFFLKSNPSTQKRKDVSYMMAHNVGTQLEYDERDDEE